MRSIRNEDDRDNLVGRINKLSGDETSLWGKMTCDQMLSHLVQASELPFMASVPERSTFALRTIVKPLVLYVLPMPKEVKVSAEFDQQKKGRTPQGTAADKETLVGLLSRVGALPSDHECLNHPMFGKLTAEQWAVLMYKHTDHHLKQFGV